MSKAAEMVVRLRQSVAEITESDAPNKDALLEKSFKEFGEALAKFEDEQASAVADDLARADAEVRGEMDPLEGFAEAVGEADAIAGEMVDAGMVDEPTAELLAQWSILGDLVARTLANQRVAEVEDEDEAEALKSDGSAGLLELAKADGQGAVLLKTDLPDGLHGLVSDPAALQEAIASVGLSLAKVAGVPVEEMLEKFQAPEGGEGQDGPPAMEEPAPSDPAEALARQVQVMMRLSAASLVQGQQILQALGGAEADPGMEGGVPPEEQAAKEPGMEGGKPPMKGEGAEQPGKEQEGAPSAEKPQADKAPQAEKPEGESEGGEGGEGGEKRKPPFAKSESSEDLMKSIGEEMRKAIENATAPLRKQLDAAQAEMVRMQAQPAAPRASIMDMSKVGGGGQSSPDELAKRLADMSPEQRAMEITKMVHRMPIPVAG